MTISILHPYLPFCDENNEVKAEDVLNSREVVSAVQRQKAVTAYL